MKKLSLLILLSALMTTVAFSQWANRWGSIWGSWSSDWVASSIVAPDSGLCCHDDTSEMMTYVACQAIGGDWFADKFTADTCYFMVTSEITFDFGHVLFDSTRTLLLFSTGLDSVRVDSIPDVSVFSTDFSGPARIAPGETLRVQITFDPNSYEYYFPTLQIFSNSLSSPDSVLLTGYGSDEDFGYIVVSASSIDTSDYQVAADFSALGANTFTAYLHHNGVPVYYWVPNHEDSTGWIEMDTVLSAAACTVRVVGYAPISTHNGDSAMLLAEGFDTDIDCAPRVTPANFNMMLRDTFPPMYTKTDSTWSATGIRETGNILDDSIHDNSARRYKAWFSGYGETYDGYGDVSYIGQITSADTKTWVNEGRVNAAIHGEDPFGVRFGDSLFLFEEDKRLVSNRDQVGLLVSGDNGVTWLDRGTILDSTGSNPEITIADPTLLNSTSSPTVYVDTTGIYAASTWGDTTWFLFFEGKGATHYHYGAGTTDLGGGAIFLAVGPDPYHLNVISPLQADPIVPVILLGTLACDTVAAVPDLVIAVNDTFRMNYHSYSTSTGWMVTTANSTDLLQWTVNEDQSCIAGLIEGTSCDPTFFKTGGIWWGALIDNSSTYLWRITPAQENYTAWPYTDFLVERKGTRSNPILRVEDGVFQMHAEDRYRTSVNLASSDSFTNGFVLGYRAAFSDYITQPSVTAGCGAGNVVGGWDGAIQYEITGIESGHLLALTNVARVRQQKATGGETLLGADVSMLSTAMQTMYDYEFVRTADSIKWFAHDTLWCAVKDTTYNGTQKRVFLSQGEYTDGNRGGSTWLDYVYVRKYLAGTQPTATLTVNP